MVNNTYKKCSDDYKPDKNFQICTKIPVRYLNIKNNIVLPILLALSIVGIILTVIATMVFLKNNKHRIVRAAGRDLCYFILVILVYIIGFTMYTTCIFWAVFLPTYLMTREDLSDNRELIMVATFILIGYITLIGLFGRKVRMLLFPETVNLKASNAPSSTTTDSLRQTPLALNGTIDFDDPTKKLSNETTFCQLEHLKTEFSDSASVCSETKIDAYPPLAESSPIPTEAYM